MADSHRLPRVTIIQIMAVLIVVFGTLQAFVRSVRAMLNPYGPANFHTGYVQFARCLVAGVIFPACRLVIETCFAPAGMISGRLAAISVIPTFVNFFLERDMAAQEQARGQAAPPVAADSIANPRSAGACSI